MLDIKVNNDSAQLSDAGEPPINKMEIITKLLVADGDIVVIGGIKSENVTKGKAKLQGLARYQLLEIYLKENQNLTA